MKNSTKRKKKTNVLNIADNKRFVAPEKSNEYEHIATQTKPKYDYSYLKLRNAICGYPAGSKMIFRQEFTPDEIKFNTMVVTDSGDFIHFGIGKNHNEKIIGIVEYIQLDLRV